MNILKTLKVMQRVLYFKPKHENMWGEEIKKLVNVDSGLVVFLDVSLLFISFAFFVV